MATSTRNRCKKVKAVSSNLDFTKVGGLETHLKLLRELIILPLIHGKIYTHFNIKAPRGIIFYGPPGTGKTLLANALANEVNNESCGQVSFFYRKGADILDKWVGESEKKLRSLFDMANRKCPSIIFFDEIDALAPARSHKNDHIHASIVATLLTLMDGIDNKSGLIIIGATNRIESIDPALRRPGRFDRELFFPLPGLKARIEILQVHTKTWKNKPNSDFLCELAGRTSGYCGSDLQALCAESVLCCLKRTYPSINVRLNIRVDPDNMCIEESDFLEAQTNITPVSQRFGNFKSRQLSSFVKPLLQRQMDNILNQIQVLLPHFTEHHKKFAVGFERYAGRVLLKGHLQQGVNSHVVPAILHHLEHVANYVVDVPSKFQEMFQCAVCNLPSILVLSRVDEWWDIIDRSSQLAIASSLDEIHACLPILVIATCSSDLPQILEIYFYDNSSIVVQIEDPTPEERESFFAPLFFETTKESLYHIWAKPNMSKLKEIKKERCMLAPPTLPIKNTNFKKVITGRIGKKEYKCRGKELRVNCCNCLIKNKYGHSSKNAILSIDDLVTAYGSRKVQPLPSNSQLQLCNYYNDNENENCQEIFNLWKKVSHLNKDGVMSIVHLELLYDTIQSCITIYRDDDLENLLKNLKQALDNFEKSVEKISTI